MADFPNWDTGLTADILGLVAKAGGIKEMAVMRQVSKTWKQGFELGVSGITVSFEAPMLP